LPAAEWNCGWKAARLHPEAQVNIKGFEELPPHRNGYFDVVSSNIPCEVMKARMPPSRTASSPLAKK